MLGPLILWAIGPADLGLAFLIVTIIGVSDVLERARLRYLKKAP